MVSASVADAPQADRLQSLATMTDSSSTQEHGSDLTSHGIGFLEETESPESFADEEDDSDDCVVALSRTHVVLGTPAAAHGCERDRVSAIWVAVAPRGPPR